MLADRTLRHAEFFGSATETAQPDNCLEGAQGGEGKIRQNIIHTNVRNNENQFECALGLPLLWYVD
jgi:hypothetical protein